MAYLKRKIDQYFVDWFANDDRLPLVVDGARQVGKTESIRQFAASTGRRVLEINFATDPVFRRITDGGYSVKEVVREISLLRPDFDFEAEKPILFFDEIQAHPDIVTTLKPFKQDGRFDVICSGSLLGVSLVRIESLPIGYQTTVTMKPMDFEEYLWAQGFRDGMVEELLGNMVELRPFSDSVMETMNRHFIDFALIGGMPAVVSAFVKNGTYGGCWDLQSQILKGYEKDITKYAEGLDKAKILSVYRQIPAQLAKDNTRFQYTKIAKHARARDYHGCVEWLADAGVVMPCARLHFPELPIRGNTDPDKFKLYSSDVGLLVAMMEPELREDIRRNRRLGAIKGALYENIAAAALDRQGFDLCYYRRDDSTLEEDFFVRTAEELLPVEVKGGNNRAQSLRTLIKSARYPDIRRGLKFAAANVGFENDIYTFPQFCLFLLKRWKERLGQGEEESTGYR